MNHAIIRHSGTAGRLVVLCDEKGRPTGTADIRAAHAVPGRLHLAFSVFLFSSDRRQVLIQQRSSEKLLWPLVWANSCCSHPRPGEEAVEAGRQRLREEMGIDADLILGPAFVYHAIDPHGRGAEHEYDITLVGQFEGDPIPAPAEVAAWKWVEVEELQRDMTSAPEEYAPWFRLGLPLVLQQLQQG